MTGAELYRLCKQLVDDPDKTFWTDQDVADALRLGYFEYMTWIANQDPTIYEKTYDFTVNGAGEYDLAGILFNPTPSEGTVAWRITRIYQRIVGQTPDFGYWLTPATSIEQLWSRNLGVGWYGYRWCLQGTKLLFNVNIQNNFRLYYLPTPTIDWSTAIFSSSEIPDNTGPWQQLIPYFAVQAYAIKDWTANPEVLRKQESLKLQCMTWLTKGRNGNAWKWARSQQASGWQGGGGGIW